MSNSTGHRVDFPTRKEGETNASSPLPLPDVGVNPSPSPPPQSTTSFYPAPSKHLDKNNSKLIFGATIGACVGVLIFVLVIIYFLRLRNKTKKPHDSSAGDDLSAISVQKGGSFTYQELSLATNGFSPDNIIGEGGFGSVYKGVLLNKTEVAIKRLKVGSNQGENEFQAEVDIISRVHHRHLVQLLGFCVYSGERMLVYEFIPNNTLQYHLRRTNGTTLDWSRRMQIALGSAKGLSYIHEDCNPHVIHRDVKSTNVLIGIDFEPKLSDFGLAKLSFDNNSHVVTRVKGTFGYLDPAYAGSEMLTLKSDVYSFGVLLLELITGKGPLELANDTEGNFLDKARKLLNQGIKKDGDFGDLVDPFIQGNYNSQELARMGVCVLACIHRSANKRPKMSEVVRALEEDMPLEELTKRMLRDSNDTLLSISEGQHVPSLKV